MWYNPWGTFTTVPDTDMLLWNIFSYYFPWYIITMVIGPRFPQDTDYVCFTSVVNNSDPFNFENFPSLDTNTLCSPLPLPGLLYTCVYSQNPSKIHHLLSILLFFASVKYLRIFCIDFCYSLLATPTASRIAPFILSSHWQQNEPSKFK